MKLFFRYLLLEHKRSIKVLKKSMISQLLILLVIVSGIAAVSFSLLQSQVFKTVDVAMVIPEEEKQTKFIVQLASNMDSIKSISHFYYLEEKEAIDKMKEGKLQAAVVFPKNFYEGIYMGESIPATIYLPKTMEVNTALFGQLISDSIALLQTAEAGVFASLDIAEAYEAQVNSVELANFISYLYMNEALNRGNIFDRQINSPIGTVDFIQYYFSSLVLVVLLISGLNFSFLYNKKGKAVEQKLKMYGMGKGQISCVFLLIMSNLLWITTIILYGVGCMIALVLKEPFLSFHIKHIFGFIPLCLSVAAYFHGVYAVAKEGFYGGTILLLFNIIMIVCSGILIPLAYLPKIVEKIGIFLPLNIWNRYYLNLLFGGVSLKELGILLGIMGIGVGIGVAGIWKNA